MRAKWLMTRFMVVAVTGIATIGLSACGGSSNVRNPTPPPEDTPPDEPPPGGDSGDDKDDYQPAVDAHLTLIHADKSRAEGATGKGIVIGIVDTGVNRDHPALKGRVLDEYIYLDPDENDLTQDDVVGHGTMTAQIAAGREFGQWPGGVAPDADIVSARIIQDEEPKDDGSGKGNQIEGSDATFFADYLNPDLMDAGVDVSSNSWGGLYFDPDHPQKVANAFADAYRPFVEDYGGLVVFAAGNSSFDDPSDLAALPYWANDLEQGWLVAVALDTEHPDQLADYSNACGKAKDFCLAAPGNVIVTGAHDTEGDPTYYIVKGTSFSAPAVSGAAAAVWSTFPYFDNDLVRQTLLGTAEDLGPEGVDKTFGWGLLNVGKAVNGPGKFAWGDVSVDFDDMTSTWSNDISGDGGLIKQGSGTLVLEGDNSYAGDTQVDGGSLQAAHALPGNVRVGVNGTLDAVPGVAGNLVNNGNVAVQDGDTTVKGDYHHGADATLAISLGVELDVAGEASIDGGTLEITGAEDGYTESSHTNVLEAGDGVNGTFDKLAKDNGVVFTSTTIEYDNDAVWLDTTGLDITTAAAGAGVSYTAASMDSAERVQGAFETLNGQLARGAVDGVSPGFLQAAGRFQQAPNLRAAQASLESLSGQLHASSAAMTLQAVNETGRVFADHLDSLMHRAPVGSRSSWTRNLRRDGGLSRAGYSGLDYQFDGTLAGMDFRPTRHTVFGYAVTQGHTTQQLNGRMDRNRGRNSAGMMYAGWAGEHGYVRGRLGVGHYHQTVTRLLLLGRQYQGVWTDYSGSYDVAHLESGYQWRAGGVQLTPFASVEYNHITREGFAEHGTGFGLKSDAHSLQRWQAGAGVKLSRRWRINDQRSVRLDARAQWRRTVSAANPAMEASFTGVDEWRPLTGVGLSRQSAVFGLDLTADTTRDSSLSVGLEYLSGDRGRSGMVSANYELTF